MLKYFLEVDDSIANFGKHFIRLIIHVFYVPQRETAGVLVDQRDRVLLCFFYPIHIHLHFYQIFISIGQQRFVWVFTILLYKFKVMVMVAKLYAAFFASFSGFVKVFGYLFIMI